MMSDDVKCCICGASVEKCRFPIQHMDMVLKTLSPEGMRMVAQSIVSSTKEMLPLLRAEMDKL